MSLQLSRGEIQNRATAVNQGRRKQALTLDSKIEVSCPSERLALLRKISLEPQDACYVLKVSVCTHMYTHTRACGDITELHI